MSRPLAIDLFTGLHGWAEGLVAEGFDVVGFDLEDMCGQFGVPRPAHVHLVIQDVLTLHGSQFRGAALIVASPPCQAYSWRAMPWRAAKAAPPPDNSLFEACFRIQREACEAAGRHIPMVVENVRGAQKWVGRARWNFGSFYLWGDVPALMPVAKAVKVPTMGAGWYPPGHPKHVPGLGFNTHADRGIKGGDLPPMSGHADPRRGRKNTGGSWFNIAHNTTSGKGQNPDGRLLRKDGTPHKHQLLEAREGAKSVGSGPAWWRQGPGGLPSKSNARKFASAMIAKIPLPLSQWIARSYLPK